MKLSIGIIGLPNVGKSTLFKILTKQEVNIANYPFATIDPNVGVVLVPDERLQRLAALSHSKKIVPAAVEFFDIAGLVKGAWKGEGLGNQFLANIREVSAVLQVVRVFKESEIIHVEGETDPIRDLEIIKTELILKDLETVEKRLVKAEADARSGKKEFIQILSEVKQIKAELEKSNFASGRMAREMNLLTTKKQLILLNGKPEDVNEELISQIKTDYLIADLAEAKEVPELIKKAYQILELISFFTTGEDETRAWTIKNGAKAPEAAGTIHTDFENKFIRAEVIFWEKLLQAGGWNEAKQKGWLRLEGKEYVVADGDVMVIRHG
ncbi:MAG: redox-regulated ATPase YchF [Patescibacteria group bacterium]